MASLGCLRYWLRHREDMERLADGLSAVVAPDATAADLATFDRLCEIANEQAGQLLAEWLQGVVEALRPTGVRVAGITRQQTVARRWDAWARLRGAGSRSDDAYVGVNLGFATPLGNGVHLYVAHAAKRFILGPTLHESLQRDGAKAQLANGRSAFANWTRGTVILASVPFGEDVAPDEVAERLRASVEQTLVARWNLVRPLLG